MNISDPSLELITVTRAPETDADTDEKVRRCYIVDGGEGYVLMNG